MNDELEVRDLTYEELQVMAVRNGRCPRCGRRSEDDEANLFGELRDQAADANAQRDQAQAQARELEEERNLLQAQLTQAKEDG